MCLLSYFYLKLKYLFLDFPDTWTVDELIARVGSVTRGAALKALSTWVDMQILKENSENVFHLLSVVEEPTEGAEYSAPKIGMPVFRLLH